MKYALITVFCVSLLSSCALITGMRDQSAPAPKQTQGTAVSTPAPAPTNVPGAIGNRATTGAAKMISPAL